jgi:hypothetical protein
MYWKIFGFGILLIYVIQIVGLLIGVLNSFTFKKENLEIATGRVIWLDFYIGFIFVFGMAGIGIALLAK